MRLAFLHVGAQLSFPTIMVASALRHMPDIEVVQMTSPESPDVPGITARHVMPYDGRGLMDYRLRHLGELGDGETISLDTDVIVQADLRGVFDQPFDVALTRRYRPVFTPKGEDITRDQPYNAGVMFSRCAAFWRETSRELATLPQNRQHWFGEQLAIAAVARRGEFRVLELDCDEWNFSPDDEDEDCSRAKAVHYKGKGRKPWMMNRGFMDLVALPAIRASSGQGGQSWQTT